MTGSSACRPRSAPTGRSSLRQTATPAVRPCAFRRSGWTTTTPSSCAPVLDTRYSGARRVRPDPRLRPFRTGTQTVAQSLLRAGRGQLKICRKACRRSSTRSIRPRPRARLLARCAALADLGRYSRRSSHACASAPVPTPPRWSPLCRSIEPGEAEGQTNGGRCASPRTRTRLGPLRGRVFCHRGLGRLRRGWRGARLYSSTGLRPWVSVWSRRETTPALPLGDGAPASIYRGPGTVGSSYPCRDGRLAPELQLSPGPAAVFGPVDPRRCGACGSIVLTGARRRASVPRAAALEPGWAASPCGWSTRAAPA